MDQGLSSDFFKERHQSNHAIIASTVSSRSKSPHFTFGFPNPLSPKVPDQLQNKTAANTDLTVKFTVGEETLN